MSEISLLDSHSQSPKLLRVVIDRKPFKTLKFKGLGSLYKQNRTARSIEIRNDLILLEEGIVALATGSRCRGVGLMIDFLREIVSGLITFRRVAGGNIRCWRNMDRTVGTGCTIDSGSQQKWHQRT